MQKCICALKIVVAYCVTIISALGRSSLFDIIDQIPEIIYSEKMLIWIFIDLSKSFETINHKVRNCGICEVVSS